MYIEAISFKEKNIDNQQESPEQKFTWKFSLNNQNQELELLISKNYAEKKVKLNGRLMYQEYKISNEFIFNHQIEECQIKLTKEGNRFKLYFDNIAFSQFYSKSKEQNRSRKCLVGLAIDVSGSMREKFPQKLKSDLQKNKINSMLKLILDSIKNDPDSKDNFFSLIFGLKEYRTCDLITLMDKINQLYLSEQQTKKLLEKLKKQQAQQEEESIKFRQMSREQQQKKALEEKRKYEQYLEKLNLSPSQYLGTNHKGFPYIKSKEPLCVLLHREGVKNSKKYVNKYVNQEDAGPFFIAFSQDPELLVDLIKDLPDLVKSEGYMNKIVDAQVNFLANLHERINNNGNFVQKRAEQEIERAKQLLRQSSFSNFQEEIDQMATLQRIQLERTDKSLDSLRSQIQNIDENQAIENENFIESHLKDQMPPKLYTYKQVASILELTSDQSKNNEEQSEKEVKKIEKYIFGDTPMCQALQSLFPIYCNQTYSEKVLILISDGAATDGDPEFYCQILKNMGVTIFSCLLSTNHLQYPRRLFDQPEENWDEEQLKMFRMASLVQASHSSLVILRNEGWLIPTSSECRLYAQVNHPDVVKEFTDLAKRVSEHDALIDIIGDISLEVYINKAINNLLPQNQGQQAICYAHAAATVFHLTLSKILCQAPDFNYFKNELIQRFGAENGADTRQVLMEFCPQYGLAYQQVDEIEARKAIQQRRPVIAIFSLYSYQWDSFNDFFLNNKKGILVTRDLFQQNLQDYFNQENNLQQDAGVFQNLEQPIESELNQCKAPNNDDTQDIKISVEKTGHAVVLIRCDSKSLTFMNSYGTQWGDNGFFKVQNGDVLNMTFFDVFFDESKKELFKNNLKERAQEETQKLLSQIPQSLKQLPYKCPICQEEEIIEKFEGSIFQTQCPKCRSLFKPSGKELLKNLYYRNY